MTDPAVVTRITRLTSAFDYRDDSEAFLSAANQLDDVQLIPKYFLLCHSIELALKAHILGHGGTNGEIRKIKHDLRAALKRARELGLQPAAEVEEVVRLVAPPHKDYSFRYTNDMWTQVLPTLEALAATVAALIKQVSEALPPHTAILQIK